MLRQMTDLHMTRSEKEALINDQIVFLLFCSASPTPPYIFLSLCFLNLIILGENVLICFLVKRHMYS